MVSSVPGTSVAPSMASASGAIATRERSVSTAYRFCAFMFSPTGRDIMRLAEMARSAKQTLESKPETREMVEKETSEAEATATPVITGSSERYTGNEKTWLRKTAEKRHVKRGSSVFTTLVKATVP